MSEKLWALTHPIHECTPPMHELENLKMELLSNSNRTEEEQKKFEAITRQIERINLYESQFEDEDRFSTH